MTSNPAEVHARRRGRRFAYALLIIGLLVGVAIGFVATYYTVKAPKAASSTSTISTASSSPFSLGAAGTLEYAFGTLINQTFTPLYPSIKVATLFEGSSAVAQQEVTTKQFSLIGSADTTTIPKTLFANITSYEIAFGFTQMVIIIDTSSPAGSQVHSLWQAAQTQTPLSTEWNQTWRQIFTTIALNSSTVVGVANPFTDPSGYFAAGMLRLAGLAFFGNITALYDSVYNNPSKYVMRNTETDLVPLAQTGQLTFVLSSYLSNGIAQTKGVPNLTYITLPSFINLGNLSYVNYYHQGNFNYTEQGTTQSYTINPVTYTLTIPSAAPNPSAATLFVATLFSPSGQAILAANGITPVLPGIVYGNRNDVPSELLPFTTPTNSTTSTIFPGG